MAIDEQHERELAVTEQWAGDPLAQFLAAAWRNTVSTFSAEQQRYHTLVEVDSVYRRLIENLGDSAERLSASLLVRSHGSFLAAASLALSGQVAEAYALMRVSLEAALQGLFVAGNVERQRLWVGRNDDATALEKMRVEFTHAAMFRHLQAIDAATAAIYEKLHERTIDRGAHANTVGKFSHKAGGKTGATDLTRDYFVCDDDVQRSCLRSAAQVGICCLSALFYVFGEQYRELELDARITKLRQGH